MITVFKHGNVFSIENPVMKNEKTLINVVFTEVGRSGADETMSETSRLLSEGTGEEVGLTQTRVHTQPVLAEKIGKFPVGAKFPGYINRRLYSTPQLRAQIDAEPRMINGQPTFFKTWISDSPKPDVDMRASNEVLMKDHPEYFDKAKITAAVIHEIEQEKEVDQLLKDIQ